ncbi:ABC transporter ATP-binding protein [Aestuariispira insulae]|uniref:Oligopeptide transport system ATP-binding protein n=1 Tax=Aestuariispira insulae TaxID=1461337 RepID=A0A3D9HWV1_9PROT|nr:oligopeptide/dipeptide ABC transporter ATP-binding protein [Aestuariispira insulae]RED53967.1 oligopeptide transport system ATP-binding protein [Aestuariispira insulae]
MSPILNVKNLETRFQTLDGEVSAVNGIDFHLHKGESLGVVGESGSGKTQIFLSIMGLLAKNGRSTGSVKFKGQELIGMKTGELNKIRGVTMSMIFQDPMTSLNPYLKISKQMNEVLIEHQGRTEEEALKESIQMLDLVGIPEARKRVHMYPHEFSGGMRQRVMIAMALLCKPDLLIADEPTTALDVTVQAQILDLMRNLKKELDTAIVMITHDLGVVAGLCDRVMVMYGGRIVEKGDVRNIFYDAQHPYTQGLLESMPRLDEAKASKLHAIPGQPPNLQNLPVGCAFQDRCEYRKDQCLSSIPNLIEFAEGRAKACFREAS